jgi:transposase
MGKKVSAEATIKDIRRQTRRQHNAEEKIRIVLEGLRGEETIAGLCRREGIAQSLYYKWSKEFLEAGKSRLAGDTKRQATGEDVDELREENAQLKQLVAELALKNRVLKKSLTGLENEWDALRAIRRLRRWKSIARRRRPNYPTSKPWRNWRCPAAPSMTGIAAMSKRVTTA